MNINSEPGRGTSTGPALFAKPPEYTPPVKNQAHNGIKPKLILLRGLAAWAVVMVALVATTTGSWGAQTRVNLEPGNQRRALMVGRGEPFHEADGGATHPQIAKDNFLRMVGNPKNDPAKGWTCDLSWDLAETLGLDPIRTQLPVLLQSIKEHRLGYRILMDNTAFGVYQPVFETPIDYGMMAFALQGNNGNGFYVAATPGLRAAVGVAGGAIQNTSSYGPGVEFIDSLPPAISGHGEDAAQSWANQVVAGRFAGILDAHPEYNLWDARQHLRQTGSFWATGWTEKNGFGRPDAAAHAGCAPATEAAPPLRARPATHTAAQSAQRDRSAGLAASGWPAAARAK